MGHYVTTLPEDDRHKVAQEFKAFRHKGKGKGYRAMPEFGDCSKPTYTVLVGASKAPCQSEPTQAPTDTRPVLRPKHKTKTVTDTRPLFDAGCVAREAVFPVAVRRDTRPVESATLLALCGNVESREFLPVFDTKADLVRFQNQNQRHAYVDFWQDLPLVKLDALLASVGKAACAKAKGYLRNKVSDTSLVECALGARHAVLSKVFSHKGEFALDALEQLDQPTVIGCAKAIGVKHGVKAATDSEFLGQRLRTNDKLGLKRATIDLIDTVAHVLAESDQSEPVARNRQRALFLVQTVRDVRATKLAATKANNKRHVIRRFNRIAKVLSLVAQGDSLQYACEQAGFGFHEGECAVWVNPYRGSCSLTRGLESEKVAPCRAKCGCSSPGPSGDVQERQRQATPARTMGSNIDY